MPDSTYRPGDIALVDGKPAVRVALPGTHAWFWVDGDWSSRIVEVGPVLGNVRDIAAGTKFDPIEQLERQRGDALAADLAAAIRRADRAEKERDAARTQVARVESLIDTCTRGHDPVQQSLAYEFRDALDDRPLKEG